MSKNLRNRGMLKLACCAALLFFFSAAAPGQSSDKIPRDVIDHTAAHGSANTARQPAAARLDFASTRIRRINREPGVGRQ